MDFFYIDNVKVEKGQKTNAMLRYRRLRNIANLFRFVEICVALILLSWYSNRLPIAFRISGEYFRDLCVLLVSPRFVFFVGNAIIITLFAKAGNFSGEKPTGNNAGTDLHDKIVENREKNQADNFTRAPEENTVVPTYPNTVTTVTESTPDTKVYRRSQSENLKREIFEKSCGALRRSETEKYRKIWSSVEIAADPSYPEEDMSSEEFRRTIEAFIAKQQRFQRQESMSIVHQDQR